MASYHKGNVVSISVDLCLIDDPNFRPDSSAPTLPVRLSQSDTSDRSDLAQLKSNDVHLIG